MGIDFVIVGQRIREARKHRGITGEKLAECIGIATESLRHIEIASSKPSLQTLYRIAIALNVSMDYLTGRTPNAIDSLTKRFGLSPKQENLLKELLESAVPIISKNV